MDINNNSKPTPRSILKRVDSSNSNLIKKKVRFDDKTNIIVFRKEENLPSTNNAHEIIERKERDSCSVIIEDTSSEDGTDTEDVSQNTPKAASSPD